MLDGNIEELYGICLYYKDLSAYKIYEKIIENPRIID